MKFSERRAARERTKALLERGAEKRAAPTTTQKKKASEQLTVKPGLSRYLLQSGLTISPAAVIATSVASALITTLILAKVISVFFLPLFVALGALLPFYYIDSRVTDRSTKFAEDYPTVLLATASSLKVGMTPYLALERAVKLLPKKSIVRDEVILLLSKLRRGMAKEQALNEFGTSVKLPDLALFRSAFLLVLDNGGRFAPTLERLASVARDRTTLISSARVSTAIMRMTANVLLALTPVIIFMIASRTKDFWELIVNNSVANTVASLGAITIGGSYMVLRRMSNFKP